MIVDAITVEWPTPDQVRAYRVRAGITQGQAAALVGLGSPSRWNNYAAGRTQLEAVRWLVFLLMTDQHPTHRLTQRSAHA